MVITSPCPPCYSLLTLGWSQSIILGHSDQTLNS